MPDLRALDLASADSQPASRSEGMRSGYNQPDFLKKTQSPVTEAAMSRSARG
jgi:hypothetical protein